MPKQLILMAGLHKTATTSIQATCLANAELLREAGFIYPIVHEAGRKDINHTRLMNRMFKADPSRGGLLAQFPLANAADVRRPRYLAMVERVLQGHDRVLMVAEGVSTFDSSELQALKEWAEQQGRDVRLVCHVRHLSGWLNSMVGQRVHSAYRMTVEGAVAELVAYGSLVRRRIENMRQVFPRAEFHSHEVAVRHEDGPVGYFFRAIGMEVPPGLKYLRNKAGVGDAGTRACSILNERFGTYDAAGQPNPLAHEDARLRPALAAISGRKFALRPAEVAPLGQLLRAENDWLRAELGQHFFDPRLEFADQDFDWTPESMAQLAACLRAMPQPARDWMKVNLHRLGLRASGGALARQP